MNSKLNEIIKNLRLGKDGEKEIKRILSRPEVKAVLSADEGERIAHRRTLVTELAAIPGKIAAAEKALAADAKKISERYYRLEREFKEAELDYKQMCNRVSFVGYADQRRAMEIEKELWAGADVRIGDYGVSLNRIEGEARLKFKSWIEHTGERNWLGTAIAVRQSNGKIVDSALQEIGKAVDRLRAMRLEALTFDEVTSHLQAITERLRKPLADLELEPPRVNADGDVKEPLAYGVVETVE